MNTGEGDRHKVKMSRTINLLVLVLVMSTIEGGALRADRRDQSLHDNPPERFSWLWNKNIESKSIDLKGNNILHNKSGTLLDLGL